MTGAERDRLDILLVAGPGRSGIASSDRSSLDLYYMGFEKPASRFRSRCWIGATQTFAGRLHGKSERLRWDHELFVQLGQFADTEIRAWSLATLVGYRPSCTNLDLELTLQFNTISGDEDRNDNVLGTFNPMFPSSSTLANRESWHPRICLTSILASVCESTKV